MTSVRDLMTLQSLTSMRLIGGSSGLNREVSWPYVILCPPIGEWVSGGEFLIYYGANSLVEKVEICQLIREAAESDAAAVLFLVGHHYVLQENLDASVTELADTLGIPVFSLTSLAHVNSITKDIIDLIEKKDTSEYNANLFWYSLFFEHTDTNEVSTLEKALFLGYVASYRYRVYILKIMNSDEYFARMEEQNGEYMETRAEYYRTISMRVSFFVRRKTDRCWHLGVQSSNIFVFPVNSKREEEDTDRFMNHLADRCEMQFPGTVFAIGKGPLKSQLSGIRESFVTAQRCLRAWKLLGKQRITTEDDLGFYGLLMEIPNANTMHSYTEKLLSPLLLADEKNGTRLYESLLAFLACRGNQSEAAKRLYLHRNTFMKHLEKIEELTGGALDDAEHVFRLETAVRIHRLLEET